jgi:hypothetical protein
LSICQSVNRRSSGFSASKGPARAEPRKRAAIGPRSSRTGSFSRLSGVELAHPAANHRVNHAIQHRLQASLLASVLKGSRSKSKSGRSGFLSIRINRGPLYTWRRLVQLATSGLCRPPAMSFPSARVRIFSNGFPTTSTRLDLCTQNRPRSAALMATSVRFLAHNFFMIWRT